MSVILLVIAALIVACILCNKLSSRIGVPMLLAFILLGMLCGSDGLFRISFENFEFAEQSCSIALIFIIFYGGFGTKWQEAKRVSAQSVLLSSAGVILTSLLTGLFCHYALGFDWLEGMLIGSVLGSTDAASVFSILRSKKLNLKFGTASMLELESGSNDPWAYTLTVILLSVMNGKNSGGAIAYTIFAQIAYGVAAGVVIAVAASWVFRHFQFGTDGFDMIFAVAVAVLSYALPAVFGGNGYLSAYIVGIVLGNQKIPNKKALVHFFDGVTGLMQMLIFFLLGLLAFPSQMPGIMLPALLIALFLTFIARPAVVALLLTPFRARLQQQVVVAWAGLRGATSIVFAIMVTVNEAYTKNDVFHIVFCVVLFSIALQGTLLPWISRRVHMIDDRENVLKTFSDYSEETEIRLIRLAITEDHLWNGKKVRDTALPLNIRIVMLLRGKERILPKGNTELKQGDVLVLSAEGYYGEDAFTLEEMEIGIRHPWCGKSLSELTMPHESMVVMIRRGSRAMIPNGRMKIQANDVLVMAADKD